MSRSRLKEVLDLQDHAVYKQFGGVVLDEQEGQHIVKAMGNKKVRLCLSLTVCARH